MTEFDLLVLQHGHKGAWIIMAVRMLLMVLFSCVKWGIVVAIAVGVYRGIA